MSNAPGDEYDAYNHHVLVSDCPNQALLGIDAATGERNVVVDTWPWPEPGSTSCVIDVVVERGGQYAYATVDRSFDDPSGGDLSCFASDLVFIDTLYGKATPLENIIYSCCDDCGGSRQFYSPQVDLFHGRLLYLESDCSPDSCSPALSASPFGGASERVHYLYPPPCASDDPECTDSSYVSPSAVTFDPVDPDHRVLVVAYPSTTFQPHIDSMDLDTGEIIETISIQADWGDLHLDYVPDIAVDATSGRVLLTMSGRRAGGDIMWAVLSIDRFTGEQTLLYDGAPTADGRTLSCTPDAAFDTLQGRLLLVERPGGYRCAGNAFALDVVTGALSSL
jgi:hypothetical protein